MYLHFSQTTCTSYILLLQLIMLPENSFWKWMPSYSPFLIILSPTEQSYLHVAPYSLSNFTVKTFFSVIKYQRLFPHLLWSSSPLYYSWTLWDVVFIYQYMNKTSHRVHEFFIFCPDILLLNRYCFILELKDLIW